MKQLVSWTSTDSTRRWLAWGIVALYLVGLAIASALRYQGDFAIYYRAGKRFLAGADLYPSSDGSKFLYAPVFGMLFAPLALLPRPAAQFVFFIPNGLALIAFICASYRMLFGAEKQITAALILWPTLFCVRFINNNVEHGQLDIIVLALVVWSIVMAQNGAWKTAGALAGFALMTKPLALGALLYLLATRKYVALVYTFVFVALLLALPIPFTGVDRAVALNLGYAHAVASMGSSYRQTTINQSVSAVVFRILSAEGVFKETLEPVARWAGYFYFAISVIGLLLWLRHTWNEGAPSPQHRLAVGGLFALIPSLSAIAWKHYFVALLVPYMALVALLGQAASLKRPARTVVWMLVSLSVLLNFTGGDRLNRALLFYGGHLLSSLMVLTALIVAAVSLNDKVELQEGSDTRQNYNIA